MYMCAKVILLFFPGSCTCYDSTGRCVMASLKYSPATLFSSCSRSSLHNALTRRINRLGRCLGNEPITTVGNPVCGNGIRERNEICDCGTPQVRATELLSMIIKRVFRLFLSCVLTGVHRSLLRCQDLQTGSRCSVSYRRVLH